MCEPTVIVRQPPGESAMKTMVDQTSRVPMQSSIVHTRRIECHHYMMIIERRTAPSVSADCVVAGDDAKTRAAPRTNSHRE